jgi:membrane-bound lytic murein transglycosylase D
MRSDAHARRGTASVVLTVLGVLMAVAPCAAAESDFTVPPALRPQVDFWIAVFAKYGKRQVVIHDTERLDRIYSVIDVGDLEEEGLNETQVELALKDAEETEKARIRGLLLRLDEIDLRTEELTPEEQRIVALFAGDPSPGKFRAAAADDRLRGQRGLRERFAHGIQVAHAYFPAMERIFREEGVPIEITRLPLIESCFNMHAYSKVGAAGVWQFMPATARNYMRVDGAVDERLDPIMATRAAARFMRHNYDQLGTWPLAIKAWNHGPAGIARAVRETGTTDAATIIENYHGPAYKFASRNFYPEFLAALHVERNYQEYFGDLVVEPPLSADVVIVTGFMPISAAARCAGTDQWSLASLNPSLLPTVHAGRRPIPPGSALRVPHGTGESFRACMANLPPPRQQLVRRGAPSRHAPLRLARARTVTARDVRHMHVIHRVKSGQTLAQIAGLYGCSVEQLRRDNKLKSTKLHAGQTLRIPMS